MSRRCSPIQTTWSRPTRLVLVFVLLPWLLASKSLPTAPPPPQPLNQRVRRQVLPAYARPFRGHRFRTSSPPTHPHPCRLVPQALPYCRHLAGLEEWHWGLRRLRSRLQEEEHPASRRRLGHRTPGRAHRRCRRSARQSCQLHSAQHRANPRFPRHPQWARRRRKSIRKRRRLQRLVWFKVGTGPVLVTTRRFLLLPSRPQSPPSRPLPNPSIQNDPFPLPPAPRPPSPRPLGLQ